MSILETYNNRPRKLWVRILIFLALLILAVWSANGINLGSRMDFSAANGIIHGLTHPDLNLLFDLSSEGVPYLILQTIAIAVLGTIIGGILALPISFLASTNVVPKWLAYIFRAFILGIRTIPSLVWALVWIRVTGPNAFCGVITQSICSIGMISKMYITAI